jgi:Rrf2 family protein
VHIPAKIEYGFRALFTLTEAGSPCTAEALAEAQGLPPKFLGAILNDLRRAGIVASQRGAEGGYRLTKPANEIMLADVMRALDGPLFEIRGLRSEQTHYHGAAAHLQEVWVAVRAALRSVLEHISLEDVVKGEFREELRDFIEDPESWVAHVPH